MTHSVTKRTDQPGFLVTWYEHGRRRKSFDTRIDAETWARDMQQLADLGGSATEMIEARREAAGTGYALGDLVRLGLDHVRVTGTKANVAMTFAQAAAVVIENAKRASARQRTMDGYVAVYRLLGKTWGSRAAAVISESDVRVYLDAMPNRSGIVGTATLASKKNYLRHIRMAMRCAGVANPLPGFMESRENAEVRFFTVDEVRAILVAANREERGFLAVAIFAGVRPENLELLQEDAVSVTDKRIRIPAMVSKDRLAHLLERDVLPDVLWKWLRKFPFNPVSWNPLQRRLRKAIGHWVQDGLRHTAATYYCATHGVSATARLLTHQGESLVRKNYAGIVELNRARRFYTLTPAKILTTQFRTKSGSATSADHAEPSERSRSA